MKISFLNGRLMINEKDTFIRPRVYSSGNWMLNDSEIKKIHKFFIENDMIKDSILLSQKGILRK